MRAIRLIHLGVSLLVTSVVFAGADADSGRLADPEARRQFAERLASATWKEKIASYDVTLVMEHLRPPMPKERIRGFVTDIYDKTEVGAVNKKGTPEREAEIDAEVERIADEREKALKCRRRIRLIVGDDTQRVDEACAEPGEELPPGAPVQRTTINNYRSGSGAFEYIEYDHQARRAKVHGGSPTHNYDDDLENWLGVNLGLRLMGYMCLGKPDPQTKKVVRDAEKFEAFVSAESEVWGVYDIRVTPAGDPDYPRSRIEFIQRVGGPGRLLFICDRDDYSRIHEFRGYKGEGDAEQLTALITWAGLDERGIPKRVEHYDYDDQGQLTERKLITIVQAEINIELPDAIFQWDPPEGYKIADDRKPAQGGG